MPDPGLHGLSGRCRDFELNWPLGLVLHDDGAGRHLVAMANVSDFQCDQVASKVNQGADQLPFGLKYRPLDANRGQKR